MFGLRTRRLFETLLGGAVASVAYHALVLACRYVEARHQMGRPPPTLDGLI